MENKNQPINQNQDNNNQAENSASSSNTNTIISEELKKDFREKLLEVYLKFSRAYYNNEITIAQYLIDQKIFYEKGLKYFSIEELKEIKREAKKEEGYLDTSDEEFDYDSSEEEESDNEEAEASTSGSTENREQEQQESSEKIKPDPVEKLSKLIEWTKSYEARGLTIEEAQRKAREEIEWLKKWEIRHLWRIGSLFAGLPSIEILEATKTSQILYRQNQGEQLQNEVIQGLQMIKRETEVERAEKEKVIFELNLSNQTKEEEICKQKQLTEEIIKKGERTLGEKEAEKTQEAEQKAKIATELERKEKELKTANDQLKEKEKELKELAKEKGDIEKALTGKIAELKKETEDIKEEIKKKLEAEQEEEKRKLEVLNQAQRELQSKEQISIETLQKKHAELEKEVETTEGINKLLETKITDYLQYLEQLEAEKAQGIAEYDRLNSSWKISQDQNTLLNQELTEIKSELTEIKENLPKLQEAYEKLKAEHKELDREASEAKSSYELAQKQLEREKRERANDKEKADKIETERNKLKRVELDLNYKLGGKEIEIGNLKHDLETETIKYDTEKEGNRKKHQELQEQTLEIRDLKNEIINQKTELANLTNYQAENQQLTAEIKELKKEILTQTRKKNWALFASAAQGFTTDLFGEKWGNRANTAIQYTSGAVLLSNMGEWTYEFWLMGIGMAILYLVPRIYRIAAKALKYKTGIELPGAGLVEKIEKGKEKLRNSLESNLDQAEQKAVNVVVNLTQPNQAITEPSKEQKAVIEVEPEKETPDKSSQPSKPVKPSNTKKKKVKPKSKTK